MILISVRLSLHTRPANVLRPGPFGPTKDNRIFPHGSWDSFNLLLFVNLPHLFVSVSYFFYNAFSTQSQVEHEWNEYSLKPKPLRVSYPTGQQVSTYRLQLPYKYSIPLTLGSVLYHWLVSNTVFLFVAEGGKYTPLTSHETIRKLIRNAGYRPPRI
jgi:hypothetical protein